MAIDKNQTISMLKELAEMAEHGALTGMNGNTAKRAVARYNSLLGTLANDGLVPHELFSALPEDATFGDLMVDAKLLVSYIKGAKTDTCCGGEAPGHFSPDKHLIVRLAPFANTEDLRVMVESYLSKGEPIDPNFLESMAPFLDSDHLGLLIRKIAGQTEATVTRTVRIEAPVPPVPPVTPAAPAHEVEAVTKIEIHEDANKPVDDIPIQVRIDLIADRMRSADTTVEEMQELSAEMVRLKKEREQLEAEGQRK